ncbi:hypothetical protein [Clostridium beijerinckii]|uniref:Uncharacterized protein n=1 Tax=Clostridium beijerinckii TaxID=1520 RepID=A0A1S8RZA5_CLOBE|nr:hypothetical protein [Clostridium beijerinckii]NRY61303.1 hypothetical protein [Clostridium beijerinckii]OOM58532.1 hypothetical protein CLBCK_40170 [Clostridium beijerinckii]
MARPSKSVAVMSKNTIKVILKIHFTDFLYVIEGVVVLRFIDGFNMK